MKTVSWNPNLKIFEQITSFVGVINSSPCFLFSISSPLCIVTKISCSDSLGVGKEGDILIKPCSDINKGFTRGNVTYKCINRSWTSQKNDCLSGPINDLLSGAEVTLWLCGGRGGEKEQKCWSHDFCLSPSKIYEALKIFFYKIWRVFGSIDTSQWKSQEGLRHCRGNVHTHERSVSQARWPCLWHP